MLIPLLVFHCLIYCWETCMISNFQLKLISRFTCDSLRTTNLPSVLIERMICAAFWCGMPTKLWSLTWKRQRASKVTGNSHIHNLFTFLHLQLLVLTCRISSPNLRRPSSSAGFWCTDATNKPFCSTSWWKKQLLHDSTFHYETNLYTTQQLCATTRTHTLSTSRYNIHICIYRNSGNIRVKKYPHVKCLC